MNTFNDAFALDLSGSPAWSSLGPTGTPPSRRFGHCAIDDPVRDDMIIAGGQDTNGGSPQNLTNLFDAFDLDWSVGPTAVLISNVIWDATPERVRLEWRAEQAREANVWRRLAGEAWTERVTLAANGSGSFSYEDRDVRSGESIDYRVIVTGGDGSQATRELSVRVPAAMTLALQATRNPAVGALEVSYTLPEANRATLELLDPSGRPIVSRVLDTGAGRHVMTLARADEVRPGIYFLRLRQGGERRVQRCTILR